MVDIQDPPEILESLWRFLVLHGQNELKEALVVQFAVIGLVLLVDSIDDNGGEALGVPGQILFLEGAVLVAVQLVELVVQTLGVGNRKPVLVDVLLLSLLPQFVEFGQNGGSQHVLDVDPPSSLGVQEEGELLDGPHDVLLFEVLLHVLQVGEGGDEFRNVLLQVAFSQVAVSICVIQTYVDPRLEQVVLPHDRMEKGLHIDSPILITIEF